MLTGHHVRAIRQGKHAAGPPSKAHLVSSHLAGAAIQRSLGLQLKQSCHSPPYGWVPSGDAETHLTRPTWPAARRGTCVRRRGPARARRWSLASSLHSEAQRPLPTLNPESFPASSTTRSTCRSSSPRHQVTKSRETSPLITRDFPQHGALERAWDDAEALLLAAPRARSFENRPRQPSLGEQSILPLRALP